MTVIVVLLGVALIFFILTDVFETIVLPRRVSGLFQLTRMLYAISFRPLRAWTRHFKRSQRRETVLSLFGPLALLMLLGVWTIGLVLAYAVLQWAFGSRLASTGGAGAGFGADLYMSGTTFFTLGLGDVTPTTTAARVITVIESGTGLTMLALVIGYLPILYQAFSRREVNISLLDARAGSPPTAAELLRRTCREKPGLLVDFLRDWERLSAELLESHISYPSLAYFRSQHEHQSWLAALTMVLDACALAQVGIDGVPDYQARLTFAMARHAAVDLSQTLRAPPGLVTTDRLPPDELARLRSLLASSGVPLRAGVEADRQLADFRAMYEPYVQALGRRLAIELPPWVPTSVATDDWQTSVWEHSGAARAIGESTAR